MKRIGLTGGIASGKSTVARILTDLGWKVLSADGFARQVMEPGMPAYRGIVQKFGTGILLNDGSIDRKELGRRIFAAPELRHALEQLVHPEVTTLMQQKMQENANAGERQIVVEVPLLFEAGLEGFFDEVWVVAVDVEEQLRRLTERDRLTWEEANQRIRAQWPLKRKVERADVVLDNNHGYQQLREQLVNIIKMYT